MKSIGLVGLPGAGKSTLFTALTRAGTAGGRANQAVVPVPDDRLGVLAEMERSRKVVPSQVRFVDVPGWGQGLATVRESDALGVVLRGFGPSPAPAQDLAEVRAELVLADLAVVEPSLENARRRAKGGTGGSEVELLERALRALEAEQLLRDLPFEPEHLKSLRGLAPLTLKPWIPVVNLAEGSSVPDGLPGGTVGIWGEIEAEAAAMDPDEAVEILAEFGISAPGLHGVIAACYRALDLVTFLTTGEDETRAWEVPRGATAPEAAGVIHTDLQRGFIRAEVVSYDDLVAAGGWDRAKARGLLRVEGKEYEVREGDVLHVRFAV